jgi:alpha-L-fucosidase
MNVEEKLWFEIFQTKLGEVIDRYRPDLIWFDAAMESIPETYHLNFLAFYLNRAHRWNQEVVIATKGLDYPREISIEDFEKGRPDELTDFPWLTDDTIGTYGWCYTHDMELKPFSRVLHNFIDIISKNGCLLLNISPRADGTIPEDQRDLLLQLGSWLRVNGEAVYNTRPWEIYGEGPTRLEKSGRFSSEVDYTAQDIRFTRSKDRKHFFIHLLGWPGNSVKIKSLSSEAKNLGVIRRISLLSTGELLSFKRDVSGLIIELPSNPPISEAYVLKLEL